MTYNDYITMLNINNINKILKITDKLILETIRINNTKYNQIWNVKVISINVLSLFCDTIWLCQKVMSAKARGQRGHRSLISLCKYCLHIMRLFYDLVLSPPYSLYLGSHSTKITKYFIYLSKTKNV